MEKNKYTSFLLNFSRFAIAALFLFSGFSKLLRPIEFFEIAIGFYDFFPAVLLRPIAYMVPWIEVIFGAYLLFGYKTKYTAGVLAALTFGFQLLLAQALLRNLSIDECGCFGGGFIHLTLYQSFALDSVLAFALLQISAQDWLPMSIDFLYQGKKPAAHLA